MAHDERMTRYLVLLVSDVWYIGWPGPGQPIQSRPWLDRWLAEREASPADVDFESAELKAQFIRQFGPLD
jgi:hypothetical protein